MGAKCISGQEQAIVKKGTHNTTSINASKIGNQRGWRSISAIPYDS